jgi:hypothetical protein
LFFQVESDLHWKNPLFQACVCVQEGAATEAGTKIAFDRFGELMLVDAQLEYAETYQFVSEPERFCFVRMTVDTSLSAG